MATHHHRVILDKVIRSLVVKQLSTAVALGSVLSLQSRSRLRKLFRLILCYQVGCHGFSLGIHLGTFFLY